MSKSSAKREKIPQITRSFTLSARHVEIVTDRAIEEECSRSEALRAILDEYAAEHGKPRRRSGPIPLAPESIQDRKIASFVLDEGYVDLIDRYARAWKTNRSAALRTILDAQAMFG